jgi:hypothetical protein
MLPKRIWGSILGNLRKRCRELRCFAPMAHFPQLNSGVRAPRVRVADNQTVRLSLEGKKISGVLLTLSITGGLAQFEHAIHDAGSLAELQIRSKSGQITALVELLNPAKGSPATTRPFRFIALGDEDQERLASAIRRMQDHGHAVPGW